MSTLTLWDLEFVKVGPQLRVPLAAMFKAIANDPMFTPHPLTPEYADYLVWYEGKDFYSLAVRGQQPLAYGILRGWDEGYAIPSLGISVHPDAQGIGIGKTMMHYLHSVARLRGADIIRLRVHVDNTRAIKLYNQLGYVLQPDERPDYLLGFLRFPKAHSS